MSNEPTQKSLEDADTAVQRALDGHRILIPALKHEIALALDAARQEGFAEGYSTNVADKVAAGIEALAAPPSWPQP